MQAFEMTDLGEMSYFLGMEIKQKQMRFLWPEEVCKVDDKEILHEILQKLEYSNVSKGEAMQRRWS